MSALQMSDGSTVEATIRECVAADDGSRIWLDGHTYDRRLTETEKLQRHIELREEMLRLAESKVESDANFLARLRDKLSAAQEAEQ